MQCEAERGMQVLSLILHKCSLLWTATFCLGLVCGFTVTLIGLSVSVLSSEATGSSFMLVSNAAAVAVHHRGCFSFTQLDSSSPESCLQLHLSKCSPSAL